jgi:DNA mismatch repair protein MutS
MAGLPEEVTDRAKNLLKNLEQADLSPLSSGPRTPLGTTQVQMTLFEMQDDRLREELSKINTDSLTPLEALQKLAELKQSLTKGKP